MTAFAGASLCAAAQSTFGVKAGYALSTANFKVLNFKETSLTSTVYVGVLGEYRISRLGLQAELLYSNFGGVVAQPGIAADGNTLLNTNGQVDINVQALSLPLLAKVYVTNSLSVGAGVNLAFNVNAKGKITGVTTVNGQTVTLPGNVADIGDHIKTLNVMPLINLEYNIVLGFFVDTRYNFGVTNLYKDGITNQSYKNGQWQVGLGYKF